MSAKSNVLQVFIAQLLFCLNVSVANPIRNSETSSTTQLPDTTSLQTPSFMLDNKILLTDRSGREITCSGIWYSGNKLVLLAPCGSGQLFSLKFIHQGQILGLWFTS